MYSLCGCVGGFAQCGISLLLTRVDALVARVQNEDDEGDEDDNPNDEDKEKKCQKNDDLRMKKLV